MSQQSLEQLDHAVAEVFALMLGRDCAPIACCVCLPGEPGLSASVAFSGSLEGDCSIHLNLDSAGNLTEVLTGEQPTSGTELAADTVGELCNMIAGSWKSRLEPELSRCELSSPSVSASSFTKRLTGRNQTIRFYSFGEHCLTLRLSLTLRTQKSPRPSRGPPSSGAYLTTD